MTIFATTSTEAGSLIVAVSLEYKCKELGSGFESVVMKE